MKIRFPIADCRLPVADCPARPDAVVAPRHSSFVSRHSGGPSERGMALIITLIMLAVTLVMAVAFLALSKRERNAVSTTTASTSAQLAADSALSAAEAQIAASILATNTGAYNYSLLVSTNFISTDYTDYNSYFTTNGILLTGQYLEDVVTNQTLMPRPPVFISTNSNTKLPLDFRYYLDLNRNGRFEDTGARVPQVDDQGYTNGYSPEIGDPQWIGVLEHPGQRPGPDNPFVARYAFLAQPIGNALDLNYIFNQSLNKGAGSYFRNEGVGSWELNLAAFLADLNTNVWDPPTVENNINNPYYYRQPGFANQGVAFEDALSLLSWRYAYNYGTLAIPSPYFQTALYDNGVDGYTFGNLMTGTQLPVPQIPNVKNWAGSDNTNHYFDLPDEVFGGNQNLGNFPLHLAQAGKLIAPGNATGTPSSYDRYTYYRLLSQLGTDSSADGGKMNLNYSNAVVRYNNYGVVTNIAIVPGAETNAVPWRPLNFFNAAANRMLRFYTAQWFAENPTNYLATYYGVTNFYSRISPSGLGLTNFPYMGMTNEVPAFGITNIPVYVNRHFVYTSAVNRILQLAANMYDASTNKTSRLGKDFPSVFRPMFYRYNDGNVYIDDYEQVTSVNGINDRQFLGLGGGGPLAVTALPTGFSNDQNVYGVPWIIGARKGFPSFYRFYMRNALQVARKLQVSRPSLSKGPTQTNQLYGMSITNQMGFAFWNPYNTNYFPVGRLQVYIRDIVSMVLSNGVTGVRTARFYSNVSPTEYAFSTNLTYWPGSGWTLGANNSNGTSPTYQKAQPDSFIYGHWDFAFLPESNFQPATGQITPPNVNPWVGGGRVAPFPPMLLSTTNYIQAIILDGTHVIDYAQFSGPNSMRDLTHELADSKTNPKEVAAIEGGTSMWDTNLVANGAPQGVVNQIFVSRFGAASLNGTWKTPPNYPAKFSSPDAERAYFDAFFTAGAGPFVFDGKLSFNTNYVIQAPFTPVRTTWDFTSWQANDPLVHYLASDLNTTIPGETGVHKTPDTADTSTTSWPKPSLNTTGQRYQPWGRSQAGAADAGAYNLAYRDPLVWRPDYWDFPDGKYPTVGWLGRVHRGTPWQTIYLKAPNILSENNGLNTWVKWTGDNQMISHDGTNAYYDADNSAPAEDRDLFDLFTTRLNGNAARGTLSVNQTGLAAWSAVLSGVVALTNTTVNPTTITLPQYTNVVIDPAGLAGINSAVGQIVDGPYGINATRTNFVNTDHVKGTFEHLGDILSVPAFSTKSPLLNTNLAQQKYDISDQLYEWLPQQTLGLLRGSTTLRYNGPRYVIYCYGQTLAPAPNGKVLSGALFGLVTNYQVTAESDARAVVQFQKHATATGTNYTAVVKSFNPLPPN